MKSSKKFSSSATTTTVIHTFYNDHNTPPAPSTKQIPIETPSPAAKSTVQTNSSSTAAAAARIQSGYRSHRIRNLYKTISSVNREANRVQSMIQRQDTVDAIRTDEKERLRMNEILMSLLLRLDSVPGLDPSIREARRKVSRKIVGMQEILDSISETKDEIQWWNYNDLGGVDGGQVGGGAWPLYWEEAVEEEMCREKGGEEMERFCAQYLGFRCFQRFLRE